MVGTIRTWIILVAVGAGCVGAAGLYGPHIMKNMFPQFFVARAMVNLTRDIALDTEVLQAIPIMIEEIRHESWRQELTLRINHLEGDIASNVDPSILAVAPMASLRNVSRWDSAREAFAAELALQMAATTILSADFHLDRERIAVYIPMLFDFSLTADPHQLVSDWNNSIFGSFLSPGAIDDEMFYQIYEEIFFEPGDGVDFLEFSASLVNLAMQIEFEYAGRQTLDDTDQTVDVFYLTVPVDYAEASADILIQGVSFTEAPVFVVYVNGSRLAGVDFEARFGIENIQITKSGYMRFQETGSVQFEIIFLEEGLNFMYSASGYMVFDGGPGYQNVSFDINFVYMQNILASVFTAPFTVGANGEVRLSPQDKRIEADFNNLSLSWQDNDVSVNIRYLLQSNSEPVIFDESNARLLTDLNIFDLLGVYSRFEGSPLSEFIGSLLP